jgi:protoheme IX farnesyltransferase
MATAGVHSPPVAAAPLSWAARVRGYVALTKPRIVELLLVTTLPTMVVAARGLPRLGLMAATVAGGALSAGGANATNMFIDRDIDAVMHRTAGRPLVTGAVSPGAALAFAISLEVAAFALLWGLVNPLSAALAVGAALFYVFVYTLWLKRTSRHNIVVGGAAGAAPALVAWAAVTGRVGLPALLLFALIFLWTPPHFWALAVKYRDDYRSVDVPMLPAVAPFEKVCRQVIAYSLAVWAVSAGFGVAAGMHAIYWAVSSAAGAAFVALAVRLYHQRSE